MAKARAKKTAGEDDEEKSSRSFWKGSISFGLVNIPVSLYSAETSQKVAFRLLDRRDFSPVHYRRVNEKNGKEVPWDDIVKGYEYKDDEYVVLNDADFQRANVEATQTIDIVEFVDAKEISPIYFSKPYYLAPLKSGAKGYGLLREVMCRTSKIGIARIVLRSREHLAAVIAHGNLLVLNLLRFAHELRDPSAIHAPGKDLKQLKINDREIAMAEELVEGLSERWRAQEFHEQYYDDLMKIVKAKIKSGKTKTIEEGGHEPAPRASKIVDITKLLKQSLEKAKQQHAPRRKAG